MKKVVAAFVVSLACVAAPVFAQSAPAVDPAAAAAVKEMLVTLHMRDMMQASFAQMAQTLPQQIRQSATPAINNNPRFTPEQKKKALGELEISIASSTSAFAKLMADPALMDDMIAEIVPLYARNFTVQEIRQLTAFYQTPLGQKMLASMPRIMAESMEAGNRVVGPRMAKLMSQIMPGAPKP